MSPITRSPLWLWLLLAVPGLSMTTGHVLSDGVRAWSALGRPTGEWAARLLILSLMATPLCLLFRGWRGPRWLLHHRRAIGMASFWYALAHVALYVADRGSVDVLVAQARRLDIAAGWLAFLIYLPLAATSSDTAVRLLRTWWKPVQRMAWAAGVLVFLHWAAQHNWTRAETALVWFAPLAALTLYRLWWNFLRRRPTAP